MTGKLLVIGGIAAIGYYIKQTLDLSDSEKQALLVREAGNLAKTLVGKVVKSPNNSTLYLIKAPAVKVAYTNYQAYINDGSKEIVILSDRIINAIGLSTNAHIGESGFYWDK